MTVRQKDPRTTVRRLQKVRAGAVAPPVEDVLAVEEPLEIRIHNEPISITMRTPGDDFHLAAGFLFTEGVVRSNDDIGTIRYCENTENPDLRNIVNVTLAGGLKVDLARLKRNFYATSSCGICGKASIDLIRTQAPPLSDSARVRLDALFGLAGQLRRSQSVFEKTGGLHAAAIFDLKGNLLDTREDIGRHNAVDKAIGAMLLQGAAPLERNILLVSGRASFEIMQKAVMASIPIVCAVSAPSSLAVQFASECGMTLVGFLRGEEMNIYAGANRILG